MLKSAWHLTSRGVVAAAVVFLILLGLYVSLGRYYVPMLRDHRDDVVAHLEKTTGLDIDVAHIEGEWQRWYPQVTLDQVVVRSKDRSATPLYFTQVRFVPDILRSLLKRSLVVRELSVYGLSLQLQQLEDGRWQLRNLPMAEKREPLDLHNLLALFYDVGVLEVDDAAVALTFANGETRDIRPVRIELKNRLGFRRLNVELEKKAGKSSLQLVVEGFGDFRDPAKFSGDVYLKLDRFRLPQLRGSLREQPVTLDPFEVSGEAWLDFTGALGVSGVSRLMVPTLRWRYDDGSSYRLDDVRLPLHGQYQREQLDIYAPAFTAERKLGALWQNLHLQWQRQDNHWRVAAQRVDVDVVMATLMLDSHLLSAGLRQTLSDLAPAGDLRNLDVALPPGDADWKQRLSIRANLAQVSVNAWKGAPGATGVDGYLEAGITQGFVDLDSDNLALAFPSLYPAPIATTRANGRVRWRITDQRVLVDSSVLDLQMAAGHANGLLQLDLRKVAGDGAPPMMHLAIGLTDSDARYRNWFVPRILSPALLDWLDNSLSEGRVPQAGFVFYGPLIALEHERPAIQLFVDTDNTRLEYWKGWPAVDGISGRLLLDNGELDVNVPRATLFGMQLAGNEVTLRASGDGPELAVRSRIRGPADDALRFIKESPIHAQIGGFLNSWTMTGDVDGVLDLQMPLGQARREVQVKVESTLADNTLRVGNANIAIEKLNGKLRFESASGLNSEALQGELWRHPIKVGISSEMTGGGMRTTLTSRGRIAMADLVDWSTLKLLGFANGEALAHMTITARKGRAALSLRSSMRGVTTELPAPLGKTAAESMPLRIDMPLSGDQRVMRLKLGDQVDARVLLGDGGAQSVTVGINRAAHTHFSPRSIQIAGDFDILDLDTWQEVAKRYQALPEPNVPVAQSPAPVAPSVAATVAVEGAIAAVVDTAAVPAEPAPAQRPAWHIVIPEIRAWQLRGFGRQVSYARLAADLRGDDWQVWLVNEDIVGNLVWPHGDGVPIRLELNRFTPDALHPAGFDPAANQDAGAHQPPDPAAAAEHAPSQRDPIDFTRIPAIDVTIHQLSWGGRALGRWQFGVRSDANHLYVRDIVGQFAGMTIDGGNGNGGLLTWSNDDGVESTRVSAQARAGDFAQVLDNLGYEAIITTEKSSFDIAMHWAGAPSDYAVESLKGEILVDLRNGAFLNAPSGANNTLKVVSFLNLNNILKRLQLDFSDLSQRGYAFDRVKGSVVFDHGVFSADDPLLVSGSSSEVRIAGDVYWLNETLDMEIAVTLPIGSNLPWVAALTGYGLPVAAGVFVASKVLKKQVDKLSSVVYRMQGPWNQPVVTMQRLFNDAVNNQDGRDPGAAPPGGMPDAESSRTQRPGGSP